jgi:predicted nucleotidyltransferase
MVDTEIFKLDERVGNYILIGQVDSHAYGTSTPESDEDFMGVAVAPLSHYTGLKKWENDGTLLIDKKETHNAELTAFEVRKFIQLCLAFNPNVIPLLYLREYLGSFSIGGSRLINNRSCFNSKRAYATMIGYAKSQRKAVVDGDTGKLGQKRKELVKIYGYDVKYAMHTVRILSMAIEFFRDGKMNVYRENDRDMLLEIRQGKWALDVWIKYIDELLVKAKKAEAEGNMPDKPNFEYINNLCMWLIDIYAKKDNMNVRN